MKKFIGFFLFSICLTNISQAQAGNIPTDGASTSAAFFAALAAKDGVALGKLLANDFRLVSFDGQIHDGGVLAQALIDGSLTFEQSSTNSLNSKKFADSGLTTGSWSAKGTLQGQPFNVNLLFSLVTSKPGGSWKVNYFQLTPIP